MKTRGHGQLTKLTYTPTDSNGLGHSLCAIALEGLFLEEALPLVLDLKI